MPFRLPMLPATCRMFVQYISPCVLHRSRFRLSKAVSKKYLSRYLSRIITRSIFAYLEQLFLPDTQVNPDASSTSC